MINTKTVLLYKILNKIVFRPTAFWHLNYIDLFMFGQTVRFSTTIYKWTSSRLLKWKRLRIVPTMPNERLSIRNYSWKEYVSEYFTFWEN